MDKQEQTGNVESGQPFRGEEPTAERIREEAVKACM